MYKYFDFKSFRAIRCYIIQHSIQVYHDFYDDFNHYYGSVVAGFYRSLHKNDYSWMKNVYNKMCKLWGGLTVIVILMIIVSPIVYQLWIGEKAHVPLIMTVLIGIYTIVHSWDIIQVNMINGVGAIKLQTYITLIGLIVHIPLSLFWGDT